MLNFPQFIQLQNVKRFSSVLMSCLNMSSDYCNVKCTLEINKFERHKMLHMLYHSKWVSRLADYKRLHLLREFSNWCPWHIYTKTFILLRTFARLNSCFSKVVLLPCPYFTRIPTRIRHGINWISPGKCFGKGLVTIWCE